MELTVTTIVVAFAGVCLICFTQVVFGGDFHRRHPAIVDGVDPVTAGGLLAPLFIAMDLFALLHRKPSTGSKPDLPRLLPGLAPHRVRLLLFRSLDHRAIAIVMAAATLIFVGVWLVAGAEATTRPRSTPKAITAGLPRESPRWWRIQADLPSRCLPPLGLSRKSTREQPVCSSPSATRPRRCRGCCW